MNATSPRQRHQPRVRRRARLVSWGFAPLVLVGIAVWFLFNIVVCMGGYAGPLALRLCSGFQVLPEVLGLFLVAAMLWLVLALRDFGRATGTDGGTADRTFLVRHAVNTRLAYRQLDDEHKSHVLFAVEMAVWTTAVAVATLVYYWFELAFPLGLLVIAGLVSALFRLGRRAIAALRSRLTPRDGVPPGSRPSLGP